MKIGILTSKSKTQFYINQAYVEYIIKSGFTPVLIVQEDWKSIIDICDGLLIPGGIDIDPTYYGEDNISSHAVDPEKDNFEREVLNYIAEIGKPIFGICRGFQLIMREFLNSKLRIAVKEDSNVTSKVPYTKYIDFYQHIGNHSLASDRQIERGVKSHSIHCIPSELYNTDIISEDGTKIFVNSMHHQCIVVESVSKKNKDAVLGPIGLINITGVTKFGVPSKEDFYVVESAIIKGWKNSVIMGVQWHPEELADYNLVRNFFNKYSVNTGNNVIVNFGKIQ